VDGWRTDSHPISPPAAPAYSVRRRFPIFDFPDPSESRGGAVSWPLIPRENAGSASMRAHRASRAHHSQSSHCRFSLDTLALVPSCRWRLSTHPTRQVTSVGAYRMSLALTNPPYRRDTAHLSPALRNVNPLHVKRDTEWLVIVMRGKRPSTISATIVYLRSILLEMARLCVCI
jgi:hypothetical protein